MTRGNAAKRLSTIVVLAAGMLAGTTAAPAYADKPACYTVAALPGECLTLATYTYLNGLEAERDALRDRNADLTADNLVLRTANNSLHEKLFGQALTIDPLRQQVLELRLRVAVLLARVKTLWRALATVSA